MIHIYAYKVYIPEMTYYVSIIHQNSFGPNYVFDFHEFLVTVSFRSLEAPI